MKKILPKKEVNQVGCVHDWEELIDPGSGGWMRCKKCGKSIDCEDPDGDLG